MSDNGTSTFEVRTAPLLSVDEVAAWLAISGQTLRYWRHVGKGPPSLNVGAAVRYRASDVEAWLEHRADVRASRR